MDQLGSDVLMDADYDEKQLTPTDDDNDNVAIITPDDGDSMIDDTDADITTEPALPLATDHDAIRDRFMPPYDEYETEAEA
ncbi:ubiquitin-specific protease ubp15, partial [Friedmanniomyces endolithicus]